MSGKGWKNLGVRLSSSDGSSGAPWAPSCTSGSACHYSSQGFINNSWSFSNLGSSNKSLEGSQNGKSVVSSLPGDLMRGGNWY